MFTVVFSSVHSSQWRKDYDFLFQPLRETGELCFCDWYDDEDKKTIEEAVPGLYGIIKGKKEWRAIILNLDSLKLYPPEQADPSEVEMSSGTAASSGAQTALHADTPETSSPADHDKEGAAAADSKSEAPQNAVASSEIFCPKSQNPFDYSESDKDPDPHQSRVPIIRLAHMLAGYEFTDIQGFEPVFEYFDSELDKKCVITEKSLDAFYAIQKHFDEVRFMAQLPDANGAELPKTADEADIEIFDAATKSFLTAKDDSIPVLTDSSFDSFICRAVRRNSPQQNKNFERKPDEIELVYAPCADNDEEDVETIRLSLSEFRRIGNVLHREEHLTPVYRTIHADDAILEKQDRLKKSYQFADKRPTELLLFATRHIAEVDEKKSICNAWNRVTHIEPALFWQTNHYPTCCRFLYMDIMSQDRIRFKQDLIQFWLAVLLLAHNNLESGVLKAYNLYRIHLDIDETEFFYALNRQLNTLEAAYNVVQTELQFKPESSFAPDENLLDNETVTINFVNDKAAEMLHSREIEYYSEGDRRLEQKRREEENQKISDEKQKSLKVSNKQRELDRAVSNIRMRAYSFLPKHYVLDEYQTIELQKKKMALERSLIKSGSHSPEVFEATQKQEQEEQEKIIKGAHEKLETQKATLMNRDVIKYAGIVAACIVVLGNGTYIIQSAVHSDTAWSNFSALGASLLVTLFIIVCGAACALFMIRRNHADLKRAVDAHERTIQDLNKREHIHEQVHGDFYSDLLTYFKLQAIYRGIHNRKEDDIDSRKQLIGYSSAIKDAMRRDEHWLNLYGFERIPVKLLYTDGFSEKPNKNPIFYFESDNGEYTVSLNKTTELLSVYRIIKQITIERDYLQDDESEDVMDDNRG
ncbi:MAG: hypothetical protein J6A01_08635 [Proteobacteria bacterium]|nr:hypothetical protein [Pseudomonadota bacterium]